MTCQSEFKRLTRHQDNVDEAASGITDPGQRMSMVSIDHPPSALLE